MRQLTPVSLVSDELSPPEGDFWCDPSWYDPSFVISEVSRFFFARSASWLRGHIWRGRLLLDGQLIQPPRDPDTGYQRWRLYDVELTAHALAQGGFLKVDQLRMVIGLVKLVAQNYNYLLLSPIENRIEPVGNLMGRDAPMAVETVNIFRDDLDGTAGALPRAFGVGDIQYALDLTDANWAAFLALIAPYVAVARPDRRRRAVSPQEKDRRVAVRAWALANGYEVGARGRIPLAVEEAYRKAIEE